MDSITIDGMEEMEFRRTIEAMLRNGQADDAAEKLRTILEGYAGEGRILPERFLSATSDDIRLEGWDQLGDKLGEYDRAEVAMSAISIDILDPQGVGIRPDGEGRLKPVIETSYFSDSAYPFSEADREDLLDGYSSFGCEWQGNFENVDTTITVEGIDDLYGATVGLENKVANSAKAELEDIQAGSVGSCYLAVLIHQAIRDAAKEKGLPRPLCVLAGSNDAYPFFDAPAMTVEEYRETGHAIPEDIGAGTSGAFGEFDEEAPLGAGGMASLESLTGIGGPKKEKKPVLTIDPSEADTVESLESLESPVLDGVGAQVGERQHIMPSIDLGEGLPPESGELSGEEPQWEPEPLDNAWEMPAADEGPDEIDTSAPGGMDVSESITPIDFGAYITPEKPEGFTPEEPQSPGGADDQEPPAPIDFESFAQPSPFDSVEDEPPAPLERFHSAPPEEDSPPAECAEPPRPEIFDAADENDDGDFADIGGDDLTDETFQHDADDPTGPMPPDEPPASLDLNDSMPPDEPPAPLDLDGLMELEEPAPSDWAAAYDLPGGEETGDNPTWSGSNYTGFTGATLTEPKPARHAIRVIAASVTNEGNAPKRGAGNSHESLLVKIVLAIAKSLSSLRDRLARR